MTMAEFALDYTKCSVAELQDFLVARGIVDHGSIPQHKTLCVLTLRQADREATFRFLDLAGKELLTPPTPKNTKISPRLRGGLDVFDGTWYPQILATRSSINQEAGDLLYDIYPINVRVTTHYRTKSHEIIERAVRLIDMNRPKPSLDGIVKLEAFVDVWPKMLLKFREIRFQVMIVDLVYPDVVTVAFSNAKRFLHGSLLSLVSFLQGSKALKKVHICNYTDVGVHTVPIERLLEWLSPLRRLCARYETEFHGFDNSPVIETSLRDSNQEESLLYRRYITGKTTLKQIDGEGGQPNLPEVL